MKKQTGFTLIELMIVVAIVAILAAVALPAYRTYTARAKFAEVITATNGIKQQVELCIYDKGSVHADCANGKSGAAWSIKAAGDYKTAYVNDIAVATGVITATAASTDGLDSKTFKLSPTVASGGQITWAVDGTCKAAELC